MYTTPGSGNRKTSTRRRDGAKDAKRANANGTHFFFVPFAPSCLRVNAFVLCLGSVSACVPAPAADLTVSAAISMKDGLSDAGHQFEQTTGDRLTFNFLASGPLMKQIEEGAPVDVFVSAAHNQMDELRSQNLIDTTTERVIAKGELVLIVPADEKDPPTSFAELNGPKCLRLAIGEPKSVPAGDYAMQTLHALKLDESLKDKLQTAANVRQVLDYVEQGEVNAGIVYRTDALSSNGKVRIVAVADESTHKPIEYPAAVVKASKEHEEADRFLEFLSSSQGQDVLVRLGFARVEPKK
jgi:molybdate transport system substrate-binding protein